MHALQDHHVPQLHLAPKLPATRRPASAALPSVAPAPSHRSGSSGSDVVVLKFGSSLLRDETDLPRIVSEIYRHRRAGVRVVAVVSAFSGQTDALFALGRGLGSDDACAHLPRLVAQGEERAAALLAIACDRVGLDAAVLGPRELNLRAEGPPQSARPVSLDRAALADALTDHDVVITPGFVGVDARGRIVLLGRGGSDLSAVFLAAQLGLDRVRLVKDVDGVYDADPAKAGPDARRFDRLDYAKAREVAGKLVQRQAIDCAEDVGLAIEVGALAADAATVIGPDASRPAHAAPKSRTRVALAGCGVVGGGVLARLRRSPDAFEVVGVLLHDPCKPRGPELAEAPRVFDLDALFAFAPDVVVDALPDASLGKALLAKALERGVSVVSANKQAVVDGLLFLRGAFADCGAQLRYAASVGGGVPMVEAVRLAKDGATIVRLEGVVNGTSNYILERCAKGAAFADALAAAQAAGFAEADPSVDLDGRDAAAKARILAAEAFDVSLDDAAIPRDPILPARLDALGSGEGALRQMIVVERDAAGGVHARVELRRVEADAVFGSLVDEANALRITLADGAELVVRGRGAGRAPTAEAAFADLVDLHVGRG